MIRATQRDVLVSRIGRFRRLIPCMLFASLVLNVVALNVPFLLLKVFVESEKAYSIPRTVELMWQLKFYWVAILIFIFSTIKRFFFHFFHFSICFCEGDHDLVVLLADL